MKYPYIGKSKESGNVVLFFNEKYGECLQGRTCSSGMSGHWNEPAFTNITREYLSNTWGEVKSKEHAEFLIELAKASGLSIGSTDDNPKSFMIYGSMIDIYGIHGEELSNEAGRKQITIPEPPHQSKTSNAVSTVNRDIERNLKDGEKYHREIVGLDGTKTTVDVYRVLDAFPTNCAATDHAIKKMLCGGLRGHKDKITDIDNAIESLQAARKLLIQKSN